MSNWSFDSKHPGIGDHPRHEPLEWLLTVSVADRAADGALLVQAAAQIRSTWTTSDTPYEDLHGSADCTDDCSGHEAGYKWADEHSIADEDDCSGNSDSFEEGCKAYVQDHQGDGDQDHNQD